MDTDSAADSSVASESGPHSNGAGPGSEQGAAQDEIVKKVMQELVFHSRAEVGNLIHSMCCIHIKLHWHDYRQNRPRLKDF